MAKILIIEDESTLLDVYTEVLESEGHTVVSSSDGEEGLSKAMEEDWAVLFLDIMLPSMDGLTILKQLKDANKLEGRSVVILSNLDNESVVADAMRNGAVDHLNKAMVTPAEVIAAVEKYISEV